MASPVVWTDARAILEAAALELGLAVAWPNEPFEEPAELVQFLTVEIWGDGSAPLELGGQIWEEAGAVVVHVVSPTGAGIADALVTRKLIANHFRGRTGGPVLYEQFSFDAGGRDEDGNYHRMSLRIRYSYQDRGE